MTRYGITLHLFSKIKIYDQIYLFIDQAVWSGASFIIGVLVARFLSPEALTNYSILLACLFFVTSGQQSLIFSFIYSRTFSLSKQRLSRALNMQVIVLLIFLIMFLTAAIALKISGIASLFSIIIIFFFISSLIVYEYFRKMFIYSRNYWILLQSDTIVKVTPLLAIFILAPKTLNELLVIIAILTSLYLGFLFVSYPINGRSIFRFLRIGRNIAFMFNFGKWLLLANALQWTSGYLVLFGATWIIGAREVGYVIAIKNLLGVSTLIFQFYESYVTPRFICTRQLWKDFLQLIKLSASALVGLCLFVFVIWEYNESIVMLILGSDYSEYSVFAYPLAILIMLEFAQRPLLVILRAYDETKIVFFAYAATTAVAVILVYPVVLNFKGFGMISLLITLQLVLLCFYIRQIRKVYNQ